MSRRSWAWATASFPIPTRLRPERRSRRPARAPRRHRHREARATARLAFDAHRRAHAFGQVLGDGEPEARAPQLAAAGLVDAVEALEDAGEMLGRYAGPVVRHDHLRPAIGRAPGRDLDPAASRRVLHRVLHE